MDCIPVEYPASWTDYELIDSGNGEKLERFGRYTVIRPDPRVLWHPARPALWESADARFVRTDAEHGDWAVRRPAPDPWTVSYDGMKFSLRPTDFKHVGLFPEQAVNWDWLHRTIGGRPLRVLNLFGYTGAATVAAARAGAAVTHVDSSKVAVTWANDHIKLNGLDAAGTRWILEDVTKFVIRELKRGSVYDGIIMDPPRFGRGTKGEVWKLTDDLPVLLDRCADLLSGDASFMLVNAYTADISALALGNTLKTAVGTRGGTVHVGEITVRETAGDRFLPHGIVARWTSR